MRARFEVQSEGVNHQAMMNQDSGENSYISTWFC